MCREAGMMTAVVTFLEMTAQWTLMAFRWLEIHPTQ